MRLQEEIGYDPETGDLFWLKPKNGRVINRPVGTVNTTGYRLVCINRKRYLAHRLAWFLHYGSWPNSDLDHINGNKDDNKILNLREVTKSQNQANRLSKGFSPHRGKYQARITFNKQTTYLGLFDTEEEAAAAYKKAQTEFHKQYAYTGT